MMHSPINIRFYRIYINKICRYITYVAAAMILSIFDEKGVLKYNVCFDKTFQAPSVNGYYVICPEIRNIGGILWYLRNISILLFIQSSSSFGN